MSAAQHRCMTSKIILSQTKLIYFILQLELKRITTQAAQTLFVIYIRDSIALRLSHLRESMNMVRKSL